MGRPSGSSPSVGAEAEAQAGPASAFLGSLGEVEAGVGLQSHPSVYWQRQELGGGGESPSPLSFCTCSHRWQGQPRWGGDRARCSKQGGCAITEDIPVVQEEHIPEACHLVTFLSAVSAFTVSA